MDDLAEAMYVGLVLTLFVLGVEILNELTSNSALFKLQSPHTAGQTPWCI